MKHIAMITAVFLIIAGLYGCGSTQGIAPAASTQAAQTAQAGTATTAEEASPQPTEEQPTGVAPDQTDESGGEDVDTPEQTPWPEPASVDYQGNYLGIAQDQDASKYPSLKVNQDAQTCFGTMKIPAKWRIDDPDGIPTLVDSKNRTVGQIYLVNAYLSQPYFSLWSPSDGALMAWEAPGQYQYEARAITLESDHPTVTANEKKKTIVKTVCLLSDDPCDDEDGAEYYLAFCLSFDKAYIDGSNVDYVISNQTIDEIVQSFAQGLDME